MPPLSSMASQKNEPCVLDSHRPIPAPFLTKTYQLVDDKLTDEIVSWGSDSVTFVVWKPMEFARDLLPNYFKHNNFSSFVRQLNTYGFRKVVPDRWEFGNEYFRRGAKTLLCEIQRRKTTNASTLSQSSPLGSRDDKSHSSESPTNSLDEHDSMAIENEQLRRDNAILYHELSHLRNLYTDLYTMMQSRVTGSMWVPDPRGLALCQTGSSSLESSGSQGSTSSHGSPAPIDPPASLPPPLPPPLPPQVGPMGFFVDSPFGGNWGHHMFGRFWNSNTCESSNATNKINTKNCTSDGMLSFQNMDCKSSLFVSSMPSSSSSLSSSPPSSTPLSSSSSVAPLSLPGEAMHAPFFGARFQEPCFNPSFMHPSSSSSSSLSAASTSSLPFPTLLPLSHSHVPSQFTTFFSTPAFHGSAIPTTASLPYTPRPLPDSDSLQRHAISSRSTSPPLHVDTESIDEDKSEAAKTSREKILRAAVSDMKLKASMTTRRHAEASRTGFRPVVPLHSHVASRQCEPQSVYSSALSLATDSSPGVPISGGEGSLPNSVVTSEVQNVRSPHLFLGFGKSHQTDDGEEAENSVADKRKILTENFHHAGKKKCVQSSVAQSANNASTDLNLSTIGFDAGSAAVDDGGDDDNNDDEKVMDCACHGDGDNYGVAADGSNSRHSD